MAFLFLLILKVFAKLVSIFPMAQLHGATRDEATYAGLLMSTEPHLDPPSA